MIRNAIPTDLKRLQEIYRNVTIDRSKLGDPVYETTIQQNGFLIGTDEPHTLVEELTGAHHFLVSEDNDKILGYMIADHRQEQKYYDDEYKTWFDQSLKEIYYSDPKSMSLSTVAVDRKSSGKGIATDLLMYLEESLRKENFTHLFSIVSLAPLTNCASLLWHTKQGFKRMAMGRPRRLFELDNYAAVLMYKKL